MHQGAQAQFCCYCLAAMGAVVERAPGVIEKMIKQNPNGTYTVTFGDGVKTTVTDLFPEERVTVTEVGWPLILEKALAVRYGGYGELTRGRPGDPMSKITGQPTTVYSMIKPGVSELSGRFRKGMAYAVGITSGATFPDAEARGIIVDHAYAVVDVDKAEGTVTLVNPHGAGTPRATLTERELGDPHIEIFETSVR